MPPVVPSRADSAVSQTDIEHFKSIANPEHVNANANVQPMPSTTPHSKSNQNRVDSFTLSAMRDSHGKGKKPLPPVKETNSEYETSSDESDDIIRKVKPSPSKKDAKEPPVGVSKKQPSPTKENSDDSYSDYSDSEGTDSASISSEQSDRNYYDKPAKEKKKKKNKEHKRKTNDVDSSDDDGATGHREEAQEKPSKRQILHELERLVEIHNITLSRTFSMHDPYDVIESELLVHKSQISDNSMITIMREGLVAVTAGVEMGNARLGLLNLDGWSASVSDDVHKYDPVLLRIKHKYLRAAVLQPEAELAFLLGSSLVSYHIKNKSKKDENEKRRRERRENITQVEDDSSSDDDEDERDTRDPPASSGKSSIPGV